MTVPVPYKGKIIIISGPSGVGKTSICKALCERVANVSWSVSATTRAKRKDEVDGCHYHFISEEEFKKKIEKQEFLEYAEVHGAFYGTLKSQVLNILKSDNHCLMDIDVQGARHIRKTSEFPVISIFIDTDLETIRKRLESRGSEREETIQRRLKNAEKELAEANEYDYRIKNEDLEKTIQSIENCLNEAVARG